MQDKNQDKLLRFAFFGGLGLSAFSGISFLAQCAIAYPGIRAGIIWMLVILMLAGLGVFGLYSAIDMYKARDGYFRKPDLIVSQLPTLGLLLAAVAAILFGVVVGA